MDLDTGVKLAVYRHFAETGLGPSIEAIAKAVQADAARVREAYALLRAQRVLVLDADGEAIRMAPPFSGVATQHIIEVDGVRYYANCAWDAFGVAAALQKSATVSSRCAQSGEELRIGVTHEGPEPRDWVFHSLVPAARWWDNIVFT